MLTRSRAAVLVLAGLTLAACGNVHPGAAATVDGQTISMKTLDKTAKAYCTLSIAGSEQQGASEPDNSDVRRESVKTLVSLIVGRKLAKEHDVTVNPSAYELTGQQKDQVAKAFPQDKDVEELYNLIEKGQELSAISVALGAKSTGEAPTEANSSQLAQVGQGEISKAFKANDVSFSPRFGLSDSAKKVAATGSLSVEPTDDLGADKPDELPKAQRCS
jgi:hypothetical protein